MQGKGLILMQARTSEFIKNDDNKMIYFYITRVEEIMHDYYLDPKESGIRNRLSKKMGALQKRITTLVRLPSNKNSSSSNYTASGDGLYSIS